MTFFSSNQLKLLGGALVLVVLKLSVLNYLPYLEGVNLGLLAVVSFAYFGTTKLDFILPILVLGVSFDSWGSSLQWGFYSLVFFLCFFFGFYLKRLFLRKNNLLTYLAFFTLFFCFLAFSYRIQNFLVFENRFLEANFSNYFRVWLINLPVAIIFYYGNTFTSFPKNQ